MFKSADCGMTGTSIGGIIWHDINNDGIQDAIEPGNKKGVYDNTTVTLYQSDGTTVINTTAPNEKGLYYFSGLAAGSYVVGIDYDGYSFLFSPQNQGTNDNLDSDFNTSSYKTAIISISTDENNHSVDCGIFSSSYGGRIWNDTNQNGIQDSGENGLGGIEVRVYFEAGEYYGETSYTSSDGYYYLYRYISDEIEIMVPSGYSVSPKDQGNDDNLDSEFSSGVTARLDISLDNFESDYTLDCGLYLSNSSSSISNFVWYDTDADGIQDTGEIGISGVTVSLYSGTDNWVDYTVTSGGGLYSFDDLNAGDYKVKFALPANHVFSPRNKGADDTKDSDVNYSSSKTDIITLSNGESKTSVDCSMLQGLSINGRAFRDNDSDGIQDSGEPGLAGVTVKLYESDGTTIVSSTTTAEVDANNHGGTYNFTVLTPGTYIVGFTLPANNSFSPLNRGSNDDYDSDANTTNGKTTSFTMAVGDIITNIDCGLITNEKFSISNFVWNDTNEDGIQDAGESGINGVTVSLYSGTDTWLTFTRTSGGGLYSFTNLDPGDYKVKFKLPNNYIYSPKNQGGDDTKDSDVNSSTKKTDTFTLSAGENNTSIDCGMIYDPSGAPDNISSMKNGTINELDINALSEKDILIYPNPSRLGYFNLRLEGFKGRTNIKMVDILGRTTQSVEVDDVGEVTIKTRGQKEGTYFVIVTNNNQRFVKKIIVLD